MMTKKDYEKIAQALHDSRLYALGETRKDKQRNDAMRLQWQTTVDAVMVVLMDDNPRFNACTFLRATQHTG